jgi:iron(II)-dependent oxidoreductase
MRISIVLLLITSVPIYAAEMVQVPAGSFVMGCTANDTLCETDERPAVNVNVPAFTMDAREVTVADYRACVATKKCRPPKTHARNQYCNYDATGRDAHPVNCIDWVDAQAYCVTQGKRLPREAEWEKAARAGKQSIYAAGDTVSCQQVIANDGVTTGSVKGEQDGCGEDRTWPVASRAPNAWGLYDMNGNAGEWIANGYAKDALAQYATGNLDYPAKSNERVIRGGSWDEKIKNLRNSFRNSKPPLSGDTVYGSVGFRCAKEAKE